MERRLDAVDSKLRDLQAMIASERDARRADVKDLRAHLAAMDKRLADSDERTSGFEAAAIDVLGDIREELSLHADEIDDLKARVSDLEAWRDSQAS